MGLKYRSRTAFQSCSKAGNRNSTSAVCFFCFKESLNFFLPYLLSFAVVLDNLLNKVLGLAVRVGAAPNGVLLIDGEVLGVSVDCG